MPLLRPVLGAGGGRSQDRHQREQHHQGQQGCCSSPHQRPPVLNSLALSAPPPAAASFSLPVAAQPLARRTGRPRSTRRRSCSQAGPEPHLPLVASRRRSTPGQHNELLQTFVIDGQQHPDQHVIGCPEARADTSGSASDPCAGPTLMAVLTITTPQGLPLPPRTAAPNSPPKAASPPPPCATTKASARRVLLAMTPGPGCRPTPPVAVPVWSPRGPSARRWRAACCAGAGDACAGRCRRGGGPTGCARASLTSFWSIERFWDDPREHEGRGT